MGNISVQEALDYCLTNPDGLGAEELLAKFPEYREELQPLLALSATLVQVAGEEPPPVPAERRAAMKARLHTAATQIPQSAIRNPQPAIERKAWWWTILRRPALAAGAMATIAVIFLWWASAGALPDSPFYGIKIASENFMLNLAGDEARKARAHLDLADARLNDIRVMQGKDRLGAAGPAIDNYDYHISQCAALLDRVGQARDDIAAKLGQSMQSCDQMFKGFGASLDSIPEGTQTKIASLYKNMGNISAIVGIPPPQPPQELPVPSLETPTPEAASTPTSIVPATPTAAQATETLVPLLTAEATVTITPPSTSPTPSGGDPTATRLAPTSRTSPSQTPLRAPTQAIPTRTVARPPLATSTPTSTRVTITPPSPTRAATAQTQPTNTPLPPNPPVATPTDEPISQDTCNLIVGEISFECDDDGITWFVQMENRSAVAVTGEWNAEVTLRVKRGGLQRLEESGTETFEPGRHSYNGEISYDSSLEVEQARVRLTIVETDKPNCRVDSRPADIGGCEGFVSMDRGKDKDKDKDH